jgi:hypothetical protein
MEMGSQRHVPVNLPPEKTRHLKYGRRGGPHNRSGRVRKIRPQPGFDPRTVQHVASPYTDYAIPARNKEWHKVK